MTSIIKDIHYIRDGVLEGTSSVISKRLLLFVEHDSLGIYTVPTESFQSMKLKNYRILYKMENAVFLTFRRGQFRPLF